MATLWSSEVNKAILEQVKVAEKNYGYQFLKKLKLYISKSNLETAYYIKLQIKIYVQLFVSIYHLYHLLSVNKSIFNSSNTILCY